MFRSHREVFEELKKKRAFYESINGRRERVWTAFSPYAFNTLAASHPEARDALACIYLATANDNENDSAALQATLETIYGAGGTISKDALYANLLRAYSDAPAELAECGMDIQRMIRHFADMFHGFQIRLETRKAEFAPKFLALLREPPSVATAHDDYLHTHRLHMGILAYREYLDTEDERQRMLHALADSVDHFNQRFNTAPYVVLSPDDIDTVVGNAPRTLSVLPLVHGLNSIHSVRWAKYATPHFLNALVNGRGAFYDMAGDDRWVSSKLRGAVATQLDRLFAERDFAPESVDAVFQSTLEAMGIDRYINDWIRPVLEHGTENLFRNLVVAYANRFPDSARTLVQRIAQYATTPATLAKFSELIAGGEPTDHHEVETKIPPAVREEARYATIQNYPRLRGGITKYHGRVALRLMTAVFGIPTHIAAEPFHPLIGTNDVVRRWENATRHLLEPDKLLHQQRESDFAQWYHNARRETIEKQLCES